MRLTFLMELVLALAVGFGMARGLASSRPGDPGLEPWDFARFFWYECVFSTTAAGVGMVVGLGTWVEAFRKRSPLPWGPGRWIWSVAAACLVLGGSRGLVSQAFRSIGTGVPWSKTVPEALRELQIVYAVEFPTTFGVLVAAVAVSAWIGRTPCGPKADAREWTGRGYAALVMLVALADFAVELWQTWVIWSR